MKEEGQENGVVALHGRAYRSVYPVGRLPVELTATVTVPVANVGKELELQLKMTIPDAVLGDPPPPANTRVLPGQFVVTRAGTPGTVTAGKV